MNKWNMHNNKVEYSNVFACLLDNTVYALAERSTYRRLDTRFWTSFRPVFCIYHMYIVL